MSIDDLEPPTPPKLPRKVRHYPHQWVGVVLMGLLPVLALAGVFGAGIRGTVPRVALSYLIVVGGLRLMGKRAFGQLTPLDLVVLMIIPEFLQQAVIREDQTMLNAVVAVSTLLTLAFVTETLTYRFERFGHLVNDKPVTVVAHGQPRQRAMDLERLGSDDIQDAMHRAGLEHLHDVKWAVIYPDGTVAIVPQGGSRVQATAQEKRTPPV